MKKLLLSFVTLLFSIATYAQEVSSKLVLQKGDIIKQSAEFASVNTQSMMGGEPMEMKTNATSSTELVVKEVLSDGYLISQTLKKMKLDFEGFGQKMNYDSDSKEKQDNPFVKELADKIGIPEDVKIGFNGKIIEDDKKKPDEKKGKGMMNMGSSADAAFLVIPQDAVAKGGWEEKTEKDGLTTRRKYMIGAMMGNIASVTVQSQTKGDMVMNRGGMAITSKVNTVSEEIIMVNVNNGRVQMQSIKSTNNGKTIMNDQESPSTGTSTITNTFE